MDKELTSQTGLNLRLYKIFRKMGIPRTEMSMEADLHNDFNFDNFDMNIFLFFLESKFNIEVKDAEVNKLTTIEHTLHFIENKIELA